MTNICKNCGAALNEGAKFCKGCGKAAEAQTGQQPAYTPPPVQPTYQAQPQQPQYNTPKTAAQSKKKGGWILPYRIVASVVAVVLLVTGVIGIVTRFGGGGGNNNPIAREKSASVKNGIIELDGAVLDFGANTVGNGGAALHLLKPTKDQEQEHGLKEAISAFYEIEITPECNAPVTFQIPVNESNGYEKTPNTVALYAIGSTFGDLDGEEYVQYSYIPAEINGGVVTVSFVPSDYMQNLVSSAAGGGGGGVPIDVTTTKGYVLFNEKSSVGNAKFELYYSQGLKLMNNANLDDEQNDIPRLVRDLEAALKYYEGKDYDCSNRDFEKQPIQVFIGKTRVEKIGLRSKEAPPLGIYDTSLLRGPETGWIVLSEDEFLKAQSYPQGLMKPVIYHEVFHFVQGCYLKKAGINFREPNWFFDATATYYEWEIGTKMPEIINTHFDLLLQGMFPPSPTELKKELSLTDRLFGISEQAAVVKLADNHGYARAAFIKWFAENVSKNKDGFILDVLAAEPKSLVEYEVKISDLMDVSTRQTAMDFYEYLLTDKFKEVNTKAIINNLGFSKEANVMYLGLDGKKPKEIVRTVNTYAYGVGIAGLHLKNIEKSADFTNEYLPVITVEGDAKWCVLATKTADGSNATRVIEPVDGKVVLSNFYEDSVSKTRYTVMVVGLHVSGISGYKVKVEREKEEKPTEPPPYSAGYSVSVSFDPSSLDARPAPIGKGQTDYMVNISGLPKDKVVMVYCYTSEDATKISNLRSSANNDGKMSFAGHFPGMVLSDSVIVYYEVYDTIEKGAGKYDVGEKVGGASITIIRRSS